MEDLNFHNKVLLIWEDIIKAVEARKFSVLWRHCWRMHWILTQNGRNHDMQEKVIDIDTNEEKREG